MHFIKNSERARSPRENGRGPGRTYFADKFALLNFIGKTLFHEYEGSCTGRQGLYFYEQESSIRGMSYHARRTTYDAQPTKLDARRTTHDARRTTHYPPTQELPGMVTVFEEFFPLEYSDSYTCNIYHYCICHSQVTAFETLLALNYNSFILTVAIIGVGIYSTEAA